MSVSELRVAVLVMVVAGGSGCASTAPTIQPELRNLEIPEINEETTIGLDESLVRKARVYEYDAYELLNTIEQAGTGRLIGLRFIANPGIYAATDEDSSWTYYTAVEDTFESCLFGRGCSTVPSGFMVSKANEETRIFENPSTSMEVTSAPVWRQTTHATVGFPSFCQELVYSGRSGSTIRVLYREFSEDMIRPAFSQELTYDLEEGPLIGFQGVRLEILDTSNVSITYRVLQSFPDRN